MKINYDELPENVWLRQHPATAIVLQVRRLRFYWRKELCVGAAISLFIWGEEL